VINADDFGKSASANIAVADAHDNGILTAASIMAGGEAFDEAVRIAYFRHGLSVGLHVTLCDGRSVLRPSDIRDLVDETGEFERDPKAAWLRYSDPCLRGQLDAEIGAQFDRLEEAGVHPDHVDGHHHLHMHPRIFSTVCRHASKRGVRWIRIPHEPISEVYHGRHASPVLFPLLEWSVFGILKMFHAKTARAYGLRTVPSVYGLSMTGKVDKNYLLAVFTGATSPAEVYVHPDGLTEEGRRELSALTSSAVFEKLLECGIRTVNYRELEDLVKIHEWERWRVSLK